MRSHVDLRSSSPLPIPRGAEAAPSHDPSLFETLETARNHLRIARLAGSHGRRSLARREVGRALSQIQRVRGTLRTIRSRKETRSSLVKDPHARSRAAFGASRLAAELEATSRSLRNLRSLIDGAPLRA